MSAPASWLTFMHLFYLSPANFPSSNLTAFDEVGHQAAPEEQKMNVVLFVLGILSAIVAQLLLVLTALAATRGTVTDASGETTTYAGIGWPEASFLLVLVLLFGALGNVLVWLSANVVSTARRTSR